MKQLKIYYQNKREEVIGCLYYPEDERTPKARVDYVENLGELPDEIGVVSACPYIVEAFLNYYQDRKMSFYIDGKEVEDADCIFSEFAEPIQKLQMINT